MQKLTMQKGLTGEYELNNNIHSDLDQFYFWYLIGNMTAG
jgi:hypothetical protein